MNQCGINEGLSEPFVDLVMDGLGTYGWTGRHRAVMQLEALRKNYEFYNRYGGFMDVLEAIALFSNFGLHPNRHSMTRRAGMYLTEAGWRKDCITLVQIGMSVLPDESDPTFNKLDGNLRCLRGGLMVIRDVWLVPQFLRATRDHACNLLMRDLEESYRSSTNTPEKTRELAWNCRQVWLKKVLGYLEDGTWKSLGSSCVYESMLDDAGDEKQLVKELIREDNYGKPPVGTVDPGSGESVNPDGKDIDPGFGVPVDTGGVEPV